LSADKIDQQKFVMFHAKVGRFCWPIKLSNFIVQHRNFRPTFRMSVNRFCLCYHGDCLVFTMGDKYRFYLFILLVIL